MRAFPPTLAIDKLAPPVPPMHPEKSRESKLPHPGRFRDAPANPRPPPASHSTSPRPTDARTIPRRPGSHKRGRRDRDDAASDRESFRVRRRSRCSADSFTKDEAASARYDPGFSPELSRQVRKSFTFFPVQTVAQDRAAPEIEFRNCGSNCSGSQKAAGARLPLLKLALSSRRQGRRHRW